MSAQALFLVPNKPVIYRVGRNNAMFTCTCYSYGLALVYNHSLSSNGRVLHCEVFPSSATRRGSRSLIVTRAVSIPENANGDSQAKAGSLGRTVQLAGLFCLWYLLNVYFNIFNKQVLKVFPYPSTITAFQFGCGSVLVLLMWGFNLHPRPKITRSQFTAILPLAVAHVMGNLLTNVSLGKVAVSFTHTIKAMEPFFTVLLSVLFLGEVSIRVSFLTDVGAAVLFFAFGKRLPKYPLLSL